MSEYLAAGADDHLAGWAAAVGRFQPAAAAASYAVWLVSSLGSGGRTSRP